jgi:AcrR family transcriptional regulator
MAGRFLQSKSITLNLRVLVSQLVATTVKGNPPPKGRGSQARTRLARRAVVDAARALFLERGYQATTIDAISDHADVPAPTVYRLFSSKLGILKALLDVSIAGDDQALSLPERPQMAALFAEPDPEALLAGFASITAGINTRSSDVYRILSTAAGSDPAAAVLLGLRERDAADLIHALMSPELYRLLVIDRGWPAERYEQWLATTLADQLTSPVPTSARALTDPARHRDSASNVSQYGRAGGKGAERD